MIRGKEYSAPLLKHTFPSIFSGVFADAVSGTPAWGNTAGLCSAGDPATHPVPQKSLPPVTQEKFIEK